MVMDLRMFFAVKVGSEVAGKIWRIIGDSGLADPPWRWIRPENYHFTLKFLGEVDRKDVPPLHDAARAASSKIEPFRLTMGELGGFPDLDRPRVIFYGIEEGFDDLRSLARAIEERCEDIGFERERRRFKAHLTLARLKKPVRPDILELLRSFPGLGGGAAVDVDHFTLMRSTLTSRGAIYEEAGRFELGP
jgi:2'-5' RNA ligase